MNDQSLAQGVSDRITPVSVLPQATLAMLRAGCALASEFSLLFLHEHGLYPYRAADGELRLAAADPSDLDAINAVMLTLGDGVAIEVASREDIEIAIDAGRRAGEFPADAAEEVSEAGAADSDTLRDLASGAPVVRALDDIFDQAVSLRASDIHFEPRGRDLQVRVRVDGVLRALPAHRSVPGRALVSRIKILAGLNIAEHRQPQDGRMRIKVRAREFDVRVGHDADHGR